MKKLNSVCLILTIIGLLNACVMVPYDAGTQKNKDDAKYRKKLTKAVEKASKELMNDLPKNLTIAVLSNTSTGFSTLKSRFPDTDTSQLISKLLITGNNSNDAYVTEDLEYQLVKNGKYRLIDRQQINAIMSEQNFQMSGSVDDNTAVTIGKFSGANVVITVNVTGQNSGRITLKALDVSTAQIITMARADF